MAFQFGAPAVAPNFGFGFVPPQVPGEKVRDECFILNQSGEFSTLLNSVRVTKEDSFNLIFKTNTWNYEQLKDASTVLVGGSSRCADGEQLAKFVEQGGCAIVHSYCCSANYATNSLSGRFSSDFHPITFGNQQNFNHAGQPVKVKTENLGEHFSELMNDIAPNSLFPPMNVGYRGMNASLKEDSISLLEYNDGSSFVAYRLCGEGMVVSINLNFCQSYSPQFPSAFWSLLKNILNACSDFKNFSKFNLEESCVQFEEFEKEKNFVKCVGIVSRLNKKFTRTKKKLKVVTTQLQRLQEQREQLEDEYQKGASMLEDLTHRIKTLREIHECNCDNWSSEEVCQWLTSLNPSWSSYADAFKANEVSGDLLVDLTDGELRTLGVQKLRDRRQILKSIQSLVDGKEGVSTPTQKSDEKI